MDLLQILILAIVQGAAELLPVSSSAHVIVAEKLMGLDPTSPQATFLLIMLHTGTMFAVIVYFWKAWRETYFSSFKAFWTQAQAIVLATAATGFVGLALQALIKRVFWHNAPEFEIEHLFGNARLMAGALAAAGVLILVSSRVREGTTDGLSPRSALWIGAVQGLCLPFRGFSRSGATISTGMLLGLTRRRAEEFSFVLAVVLTPVLIVKEAWRVYKAHALASVVKTEGLLHLFTPSLLGMVFSFLAGLLALRWLSSWLERGRWYFFGCYCLLAAGVVLWVG
ncbi:MAG: undecaprenyl-diphosphate phosphatase [Proteobacteria bacterium]|nr:undecaprenyl-diphosphate phosphatase [Pseudomonadota bacterium]